MKKLFEVFKPKAKGERVFFNSHTVKTQTAPGTDPGAGGTKPVDRSATRQGYNPGEDEAAYDFGQETKQPEIQAVAEAAPDAGGGKRSSKSNNPKNGFYGTVKGDKDKAWNAMHTRVNKLTGEANDTKIRDFLDSDHGRHIARTLLEPDYDGDGEKKVDGHIKTSWSNFHKSYKPSKFMQVREGEDLTERKHHKHKKGDKENKAARYSREKNEHYEREIYHRQKAMESKDNPHAAEWHSKAADRHAEISHHFGQLATHHFNEGDK
jgi:hypothetical protein